MQKDIEPKNPKGILNKKRKRTKSKQDLENYEDSIKEKEKNKIKKEEIKNYLKFPDNQQKDIYNKYADIDLYSIARNIYTTTTKCNYKYICQEIKSDTKIKINDAKILGINDKNILFLLSDNMLYIYEIKEFINFLLIKKIELNANNNFEFSSFPKNIFFITPQERKSKKGSNVGDNKKKSTKEILYLCILSNNEKYICSFDLKKYDFKTTNKVQYSHFIQLGAYKYTLNNYFNTDLAGCAILHISKKKPSCSEYMLEFNEQDNVRFINQCERTFISMLYTYYNSTVVKLMYDEIKN